MWCCLSSGYQFQLHVLHTAALVNTPLGDGVLCLLYTVLHERMFERHHTLRFADADRHAPIADVTERLRAERFISGARGPELVLRVLQQLCVRRIDALRARLEESVQRYTTAEPTAAELMSITAEGNTSAGGLFVCFSSVGQKQCPALKLRISVDARTGKFSIRSELSTKLPGNSYYSHCLMCCFCAFITSLWVMLFMWLYRFSAA